MRLVLWHGYLLEGTGSNIYTQHVARAWGRLGHDVVVVCQEPRPERFALGPNVRVVRPDVGPLLPDVRPRPLRGHRGPPRGRHDRRPSSSCSSTGTRGRWPAAHDGRADLVLANHVLMGGPVAARACAGGTTHAVKIHGSELEYAIRGRPQLAALAVHSLAGASALFAGSGHIVEVTEELLGQGASTTGSTSSRPASTPTRSIRAGATLPRSDRAAAAETRRRRIRAGRPSGLPTPTPATGSPGVGRFVLYFGKLMRQKGVHLLLEAWSRLAAAHPGRGARGRRVRRRPRRARVDARRAGDLHGCDGPRAPPSPGAARRRGGRAVGAPGGVRDGRGRGGGLRCPPDRGRPLGSGRGRRRPGRERPHVRRHRVGSGSAAGRACWPFRMPGAARWAWPRARPWSSAGAGTGSRSA